MTQRGGRKKVDVNPADSRSMKNAGLCEVKSFGMTGHLEQRQIRQKGKNFFAILKVAAGQFTNHKGVCGHLS